MSWTCPHQREKDGHCERLNRPCRPLQKGCVLAGKFKTTGPVSDSKPPKPPAEPHAR